MIDEEKKFWTFLRSGLRRLSQRHPSIYGVLNKAKGPYNGPNKRQKVCYKCNVCGGLFSGKDVAVDHIIPCGKLSCKGDIADFIDKLFPGESGLQVICNECHGSKTLSEKLGISVEEAKVRKIEIVFEKLPAKEQTIFLTETCKYSTIGSNSKQRVEQYREWLKKEKTNGNC